MRFRFPWLIAAAALATLVSPRVTMAQQWLSDRSRAEGRGIHLGDFELHPGIGTELGWTDNVYLADKSSDRISSFLLHVVPHLFLSTLGAGGTQVPDQSVGFRAGVSGVLREYFNSKVAQQLDMGVGQDARLFLRPSKIFRADFYDEYRRTVDPFVEATRPLATGNLGAQSYAHDMLGVGTRMQLSSRGELFRAGVGYRFDIDHYEDKAFAADRNHTHSINADTSWEFLPKTALVWNGSVRIRQYVNPSIMGVTEPLSDSVDVSSLIGLNGVITSRISATIAGGYAAGFFDRGQDFEGPLVQGEVRWQFRPGALWALGYDRQYAPAFLGNFARSDRIKTRLQAMFAGALLIAAKAEFAFLQFGADAQDGAQGPRSDKYLSLNLSGEYRFVDWFALTGEVGYIQDFSDYALNSQAAMSTTAAMTSGGMAVVADPVKFHQLLALIGVRAFL